MALVNIASGYSNILAATVNAPQIVAPPTIAPEKYTIIEGDPLVIRSNDSTRNFIVEVSSDPDFRNIVSTKAGAGSISIMLSRGTYWIRGAWQASNITPVGSDDPRLANA